MQKNCTNSCHSVDFDIFLNYSSNVVHSSLLFNGVEGVKKPFVKQSKVGGHEAKLSCRSQK